MPIANQVPQWKDWSENDKKQYILFKSLVDGGNRLGPEDWNWFALRNRNLKFYAGIRRRAGIRRHFHSGVPGDLAMRGFNTSPR